MEWNLPLSWIYCIFDFQVNFQYDILRYLHTIYLKFVQTLFGNTQEFDASIMKNRCSTNHIEICVYQMIQTDISSADIVFTSELQTGKMILLQRITNNLRDTKENRRIYQYVAINIHRDRLTSTWIESLQHKQNLHCIGIITQYQKNIQNMSCKNIGMFVYFTFNAIICKQTLCQRSYITFQNLIINFV
ncbi:Hypothetical_protein [Hexamita inflata]|uniref:Hypothetical_protein n=1 Tax=Hexamita inflata TaxID=28002 RepID=A0AA86RJD8_9EUKA|nr:Hypothetical protein HINF_LOCUS63568 [Hexamita inflata]